MRHPDTDLLILGDGEDEIAIGVVSAAENVSRPDPEPNGVSRLSGATNLICVRARS
jgi:hypothetical protein